MDLWRSLSGIVEVKLTSADPACSLREINMANIPIFDVIWLDDLTVRFRLRRIDYRRMKRLTIRKGDRLQLNRRHGSYWVLKDLFRRPILLTGALLILILSLWIPSRIFFVQVEGNRAVPTQKILEEAQNCGITFGAYRRVVRSEKMKNSLLEAIPELQWAGINTSGCTATISVKERTIPDEKDRREVVSSIVDTQEWLKTTILDGLGNEGTDNKRR